jgi:hypothetical protein
VSSAVCTCSALGFEAGCPLRVICVVLALSRSLPIYPDKQTLPVPVSMSQECQYRKYRTQRCGVGRRSGTILTFNPTDEERDV